MKINIDNINQYIKDNIFDNQKLNHNKPISYDELLDSYLKISNGNLIKLPLPVSDNKFLHINKLVLDELLDLFIEYSDSVESKRSIEEKILSSTKHEMYNSLLIENYVSSRKLINDIVNSKHLDYDDELVSNMYSAMLYITRNKEINKENIYFLYQTLTNGLNLGNEKLDGKYYRNDEVYIGKNKGVDPNRIDSWMNKLIDYINEDVNSEKELILRAIIVHFYFELIHPYYDFNGRTGRLLVLWYCHNKNIFNNFAFFSTAISSYRESYLKVFKRSCETPIVDCTYFVANILKILIKQKHHYKILLELDKYVSKKFDSKLSGIQKDIIMWDLAQRDIYDIDENGWISISKVLVNYKEYSKQIIYREISKLESYGLLVKSSKKDSDYKILYSLVD